MFGRFENFMRKLITPKTFSIILVGIYFLSLIPLLIIGQYNAPSGDDFATSVNCRDAWLATHSVFPSLGFNTMIL